MNHLNIRISGRVQAVAFRASAQATASELTITGFVRNKPDGSVYIEAEGEEADLNKFLTWCQTGPHLAAVNKVEISEGNLQHFPNFQIH